jgi:hypothetical protein
MSGSASGTYEFVRQGVTQLDVVGFSANRLGRQIKYPSAGSLGSPGSPVQITARGGSSPGSTFTVTLATSTIGHEYVGGGVVTVGGTDYPITSATYNGSTGVTVLTATGYAPTIGASITLAGLSFICDSASRPNAGQIMFPQLVFPRNASTEAPEAKTFAYNRTGNFTLTYTEAASPAGPEHEYVSGGTATIGGTDYGVAGAVYNKTTGLVTLTTKLQLPTGNGNVTVDGLRFICPTSGYVVTSSVPINASGVEVANTDPTRAGYRVVFFSGTNGGLKDPISQDQILDFRNRSQITAPGHTFEYVGSGTNYDALPQNGGVPVQANAIVETNNGKVYSSNTNEKGDFRVGDQFAVDGTTGSVTINSDQFNLSGLNFIGPFSRNGGISTVGEQLREVSNNTSLIASTGAPDGNTAPTQFAVKTYADGRFLQDVTVTAGTPLILTDTSTQDGQGFWTRRRNLSISATPTFEGLTITGTAPVVIPHIHGSIAGNFYVHVKNTSGGPLAAGTAVYATGSVGDTDRITVAACDPTDPLKMPAIAVLETTLANNGDGDAVVLGELRPFNTNSYQLGDHLYVGAGGALVATIPASGEVQQVGSVARVNVNTGTILVNTGAAMARVGFTGAYGDLSGRPTLGTAAAASTGDFAPAAQGVTNGNNHNHDGGDGAQIAYNSLSGLPTIPAPADAAPAALAATAAIGTSTDYAREDHAHQRDSDVIVIPVGDETTPLTNGTNKVRFRMPFAATLLAVRADVNTDTPPTGSALIVDVNEAGTSVLGTKLSIDAGETTSTTAASAATITDSSLADVAEISIDIDQIGSTLAGAGLKVSLFVRRA